MSPISSSGHAVWVATTFASTIVSFFLVNGMFNVIALKTNPLTNYDRVFMYITSITIAVVFCGGGVMLLWYLFKKRGSGLQQSRVLSQMSRAESPVQEKKLKDIETPVPTDELWQRNVIYGRRPSWKEGAQQATRQEGKGQEVSSVLNRPGWMGWLTAWPGGWKRNGIGMGKRKEL